MPTKYGLRIMMDLLFMCDVTGDGRVGLDVADSLFSLSLG